MASARDHHQLHTPHGTTAAPPPTPSIQPNLNLLSTSSTIDTLSLLLHRLPPSLSLPTRRPSQSPRTTTPPVISLSSVSNPDLLSAASQLGFFQLTDHSIPSQLARSAESESISLFNLSDDEKTLRFPKNWPLGFDSREDDDGDETGAGGSFCIDPAESTELGLGSVGEFAREMERVGLEVVEALSCAVGFVNPVREDPNRVCSLMWISQGSTGNEPVLSSKLYPYVVGLEYQIRRQKCSLLADSGWVLASPQVDSVLVTVGDIAQVWSNGKLKKVRGRGLPCLGDDNKHIVNNNNNSNSNVISSITLLITLPLHSSVSPLLPTVVAATDTGGDEEEGNNDINAYNNDGDDDNEDKEVGLKYKSFSFEDYAWRVYHERLLLKDPLDRYLT